MSNLIYGIIYKATLKNDGRVYIGQTTKHLLKRINEHKHASKNSKFDHFHSAIKKYGFDNFDWEIIKECLSKQELDLEEEKFIKIYDSQNIEKGFNLKSGGSYGKHNIETKNIISDGKKAEKNPMFGKPSWNKGKKLSDEHKNKIKTKFKKGQIPWNKGTNGKYTTGPRTEEEKRKISEANKAENNGMSKLNWNIVREIRKKYSNKESTLKEMAEQYKVSRAHLSDIVNFRRWRE